MIHLRYLKGFWIRLSNFLFKKAFGDDDTNKLVNHSTMCCYQSFLFFSKLIYLMMTIVSQCLKYLSKYLKGEKKSYNPIVLRMRWTRIDQKSLKNGRKEEWISFSFFRNIWNVRLKYLKKDLYLQMKLTNILHAYKEKSSAHLWENSWSIIHCSDYNNSFSLAHLRSVM